MKVKDYMWSVANKLVKEYEFSTLQTSKNTYGSEENIAPLNLIKNVKNEHIYIRLVYVDYVWPNHLEQDMERLRISAKQVLARLKGNSMRLLNIYIFNSTPTDDVHKLISTASRGTEKNVDTFFGYIDLNRGEMGIPQEAFDEKNLKIDPFIYYLTENEPIESELVANEIKTFEENRLNEVKNIFSHGKPYLTYIFIIINAIIFLMMTFSGGSQDTGVLLDFGAKESYLIMTGEYWRLITPIFLHIGFLHFALNNIALFYLGKLSERIFGSVRFFFIYMIAGIIGNIASFVLAPESVGAGASGAIFGLFGALLYFGLMHKELFLRTIGKDIITIIIINIVFGLLMPDIDSFAHLGGLFGGFIVAAILSLPGLKRRIWSLSIGAIIVLIAIAGFTYMEITDDDLNGSQAVYLIGQKALDAGNYDKADEIFSFLVEEYPDEAFNYFNVANTSANKGDYQKAIEYYNITIELNEYIYEAYYKLALISVIHEDYDQAESYLLEVLDKNPNFTDAEELLEDIKKLKIQVNG